jgi:cation:H+ antiporter
MKDQPRSSGASLLPVAGALILSLPWIALTLQGFHGSSLLVAALAGVAILGAAFVLSWAAELVQMDVSQAMALALLALIAVLPEYAVDAVFAFEAGRDPAVAQAGYAVANMTGGNRLLIGIGWSSVMLLAWWRHGARRVALDRGQVLEMSVLLLATVYALAIPFKGELNLLDTGVLVSLFCLYLWAVARAPAGEPHLVGPAATMGAWPTHWRRAVTVGLFAFAGFAIFMSAEPFAHALVDSGKNLGIDEFLLVQWLAPLASEAPEFIVALLFVWRGQAAAGMRTLVSSKVNQWTLLIATLPIVFSLGAGSLGGMPLVSRQQHELWLTAAQSLFAVVLISEFAIERWEALALLVPFLAQLVLPPSIGGLDIRMTFTALYGIAAVALLMDAHRRRAIADWPRSLAGIVSRAEKTEETGQPLAKRKGGGSAE